MTPSTPSVSVVVPTRNRQHFIDELIAAILGGSERPDQIVVVDQSDERDPRLAGEQDEAVVYRFSATRGSSAARNEGINAAGGDVIAFLDDDVLPDESWLATLVKALREAGERAVVTGQVLSGEPETVGAFAPSLRPDERPASYRGRAAANVLWTNNMAMHRDVVGVIGLFDERLGAGLPRFPAGEDNDFCFRLLEAGYTIVYEPAARVQHRAWRQDRDYVGLRWGYARGQGGFYAKHLGLRDRYMLRQLTGHVASCSRDALRRGRSDRRAAIGSAVAAAGIVVGAADWLVTKRLLRRSR